MAGAPDWNWGTAVSGRSRHDFERIPDVHQKIIHGEDNLLAFKGLSFLEAYLEDRLWIVLDYRSVAIEANGCGSGFVALVSHREIGERQRGLFPGLIDDGHFFDIECGVSRDKDHMLIVDVEFVQPVQLPAFVRLYLSYNCIADGVARGDSLLFMSIEGSLNRLSIMTEGKLGVPVDSSAVGFNKDTVGVVKSGVKVVNGVPKDGRGMPRKGGGGCSLPLSQVATVVLGEQSLGVLRDVSSEYQFELVDVMFGPFYL